MQGQIDLRADMASTGLAVLIAFASVILLNASISACKYISKKKHHIPEVVMQSDGVAYTRLGSQPVLVKWAKVIAIDYTWGPWYEDVWGVFPECVWSFSMTDGRRVRIEDGKLTSSILIPAMKPNFIGFVGEREALQKLAWNKDMRDGSFRCWPVDG